MSVLVTAGKITYSEVQLHLGQVGRTWGSSKSRASSATAAAVPQLARATLLFSAAYPLSICEPPLVAVKVFNMGHS